MALARLNHTYLKAFPMRIMWCQRDPLPRKTGVGNLFVKNLAPSIDNIHLHAMFTSFGTILSCKVAEENGKSKGFGFVQFETEESALAALYALHGSVIEGKKLYVSKFIKKSERMAAQDELNFTNLYVKNLGEDMTEELLRDQFSKFGKVSNVTIMKDSEGKSRGFGFVNFDSSEEAKNAAGALNGAFIGRAQRKAEREELLKRAHMERYNCHNEQLKASNLYVKNLNASVNENKLKEHFSTCGQLMSVKVMRDGNGISKGFGFVCFSNHEDAMKALSTLNGTILEGRPLYVAMAQRKEDRFKALQNSHPQFSAKNFYPLNWNVLPEFHPLLHHFPPSPPLNHLQPEPIMYHNFHTNVGGQYPLATQTFHDHFSVSVPTRQREWGDTKDQVYQQHKLDSRKKGIKRSGPAVTVYTGPAGTKGRAHAAGTSPGNSKRGLGNLFHPLAENLQITGMLLENQAA
uniref:RRM domain-containing protein n=1 Tax=Fagus sylvatica TaxID=28930 RepID=A0A2N9E676_FAGSY